MQGLFVIEGIDDGLCVVLGRSQFDVEEIGDRVLWGDLIYIHLADVQP